MKHTWGNYIIKLLVREIVRMKTGNMTDTPEFAQLVDRLKDHETMTEILQDILPDEGEG